MCLSIGSLPFVVVWGQRQHVYLPVPERVTNGRSGVV